MLPSAETTPVTMEFGTFGPLRVLRTLQAENWQHHHGVHDGPAFRGAKAQIKRAFYSETLEWMGSVWEQGREIIDQALMGLSSDRAAGAQ